MGFSSHLFLKVGTVGTPNLLAKWLLAVSTHLLWGLLLQLK